jgi:hypothetical protein
MQKAVLLAVIAFVTKSSMAQNVGIGTTSPQRQLHLNGTAELLRIQGSQPWIGFLSSAETDYGGFVYYPDTSLVLGSRAGTNKPVVLAPNNGGLLWASPLNSGRVGIGVAAPSDKLHISSAVSGEGLRITAPSPALRLYENEDEKGYVKVTSAALEVGSAFLPVDIKIGNIPRLSVGTNTNVGISTSPLAGTRLHVDGGTQNDVVRVSGTGNPGISWYVNGDKAGSFEIGSAFSTRYFDFKAESFAPAFRFTDAGTGNNGMQVHAASGTVTIGNSTTAGSLTVNGYTSLGGTLDAPAVKMKLVTGTMPAAGATLQYFHGLALNQVIGISILAEGFAGNRKVAPGNSFAGNEYTYLVFGGNIEITTSAGNSGNVAGRPVTICITYTQ